MTDDEDDTRRILTRKELAREQRRAAYKKAKEQRAKDPRYLAQKEAAKEQRRAAYQKLKASRKAEAEKKKLAAKQLHAAQREAEREGERSRILSKIRGVSSTHEREGEIPSLDAANSVAGADGAELESLCKSFNWVKGSKVLN